MFHAALAHVEAFPIDFEFLKDSKIGKVVKKIAGAELEGDPYDLKNRAQVLMDKWKAQFLMGPPSASSLNGGEDPSSSSSTLDTPTLPPVKVEQDQPSGNPPVSPSIKSPSPKPVSASPTHKPASLVPPPQSPKIESKDHHDPMEMDPVKEEEDELTQFITDTIDSSISDLRDGLAGQDEGASAVSSFVTQESVDESGASA